jgi:hypothetical protein
MKRKSFPRPVTVGPASDNLQQLADDLARVITNPECPDALRDNIRDWWLETESIFGTAPTPEQDADDIRRKLPRVCGRRNRIERFDGSLPPAA